MNQACSLFPSSSDTTIIDSCTSLGMTRYAVSPRVCFSALLVVVGSVVLFTAVVISWRSVLGSCSTSASVLFASVVPCSPLSPSFSPSASFFIGGIGLTLSSPSDAAAFIFTFLGSVPSLVARWLSLLLNLAFSGPAIHFCSLSFDLSVRASSHTHLHPYLVQLAAHHLPREFSRSYFLFILFLCTVIAVSFKFWLYYFVVPSFKDAPLDEEESWPIHTIHQNLASTRTKFSVHIDSFWHRLLPSTLAVSSIHHLWIPMISLASTNIIVDNHYFCFKPSLGITHCQDYSIPIFHRFADSFLRSLNAVWRAPLTWYSVLGLVTTGTLGYLVYWHILIYFVVRAYFLRKARQLLKAAQHAALVHPVAQDANQSVEFGPDVSLEADSDEEPLEAGRIEDAAPSGNNAAILADATNTGLVLGLVYDSASNTGPQPDSVDNSEAIPSKPCDEEPAVLTQPIAGTSSGSRIHAEDVTETPPASSVDTNISDNERLKHHEPPVVLAPLPAPLAVYSLQDAYQYSHRFPEGHQLPEELLERFELTSVELGTDNSGFRLKARSRQTGHWVSVKFFPPQSDRSLRINHADYGSLPYELFISTELRHRNIVSTQFASKDDFGWAYIVQEMGFTLTDFVATAEYQQRKVDMARHIFIQIVEAVHYLDQKGVAHNDIRMDNIIVNEFAEVSRFWDF
ncbi:hypothetical protein BDY19DRAFT_178384 [Irpex rosettiformis]|uniref:Uncharacterized protein n=1 Tax=Irpex rosettiformis TaxID=378272 RepID=A0ACB8U2U2_9APHY|nr:hypothetical protein BDY19DRAFT_178384 [Irpex rosettiformis]